jgi:hypothetical protein
MTRGQFRRCLIQWASKKPKGPIANRATINFVGCIGFDTHYRGGVPSMQQRMRSVIYERTESRVFLFGGCLYSRYKSVKSLARRANDLH